jgi:alkylhydroperoxidase family enzyme
MFLAEPESSDATERIYKSNADSLGFVMNLTRAWAWRPDVYEAFAALRAQLTSKSSLTRRDQAVIVCATAAQLGDSYCSLAWGKTLAAKPPPRLPQSSRHARARADGRDRALAAWARKVVADPNGHRV